MMAGLRARKEWQLAQVLPRADRALAVGWWTVLVLRGLLPAAFAVAMGALVGAVQQGQPLTAPLAAMGVVFVSMQVLSPVHQALGANLGNRTAAWLYDELTRACVKPPGVGHLESPKLVGDLTMARDFDLGISGPPMSISMDFIARELVEMVGGLASAAVLAFYAWWAPLVLAGAWARHPLAAARERRCGATARPTRCERPSATPSTRTGWRSIRRPPRSCASSAWRTGRSSGFRERRRRLFDLRWHATRLRERPVRLEPAAGAGGERARLLRRSGSPRPTAACPSTGSSPSRAPPSAPA